MAKTSSGGKRKESRLTQLKGINTYINPLQKSEAELLRAVNVDSQPYLAKSKRPGYTTFLGTADGSIVNSLFSWTKNDGTTLFLYRASGTKLYYSLQGTGAWTVPTNGTITAGGHVDYAVLADTLMICDGVGSTRHTTTGTAFTDTTAAPVAVDLEMYQNRIYAAGTASTLFYSSAGTPTDWDTTHTSSSFTIPGAGKLSKLLKTGDRLISLKNSGEMQRWDGYSLVDLGSNYGASSPYSIDKVEDYYFYLNRYGIFGFNGSKPELISNKVQHLLYNNSGSAVAGTVFDNAPGITHIYDYYVTVGTTTDDLIKMPINDCIIKYNFTQDEFLTWQFANKPTAWCSYTDTSGNRKLIFGASGGQCYTFGGTAVTDNGVAIESDIILMIYGDNATCTKEWHNLTMWFNPGCEANVQYYCAESFDNRSRTWTDAGQATNGMIDYKFLPNTSRGALLFLRVTDRSKTSKMTLYGFSATYEEIEE